jgi:hypothetical protein
MKKRQETGNLFSLRNIIFFLIVIILLVIAYLLIFSNKENKEDNELNQIPAQTPTTPVAETPTNTPTATPETIVPDVAQTEFCMDALRFETAGWCPRNSITQKRMVPQGPCVTDAGKPGVFCK